jgi:hypothetical protein
MSISIRPVDEVEKSAAVPNSSAAPTSVLVVLVLENATLEPVIGRDVRDGLNTASPMYPSTLAPAQSGPATVTPGGGGCRPSGAWRIMPAGAFTFGLGLFLLTLPRPRTRNC